MNPYQLLNKIAHFRGFDAVIRRPDGTTVALRVKPEETRPEELRGDYVGTVAIKTWSFVPTSDFRPNAGDVLVVFDEDGKRPTGAGTNQSSDSSEPERRGRRYVCARSATTARYWDDMFQSGRGERILFYTQTNGTLVPLEN